MLEISIDRGLCMGAGECVHHAPRTFALDNGRRAIVLPAGEQERDGEEVVLDAARSCPNFAVRVTRDGADLV